MWDVINMSVSKIFLSTSAILILLINFVIASDYSTRTSNCGGKATVRPRPAPDAFCDGIYYCEHKKNPQMSIDPFCRGNSTGNYFNAFYDQNDSYCANMKSLCVCFSHVLSKYSGNLDDKSKHICMNILDNNCTFVLYDGQYLFDGECNG